MKKNKKSISAVHLMMMALGTVVGGSFFLGSTVAIRAAGSAVIISYILGGILVYIILFTLSELTVADAAPGSFCTFAEREFGPGLGFVVGWVYWTGMVLAMSSEALALSILIKDWFANASLPLLGTIIISIITLLNLLGADKLSKMEFGLAFFKLFAVAGFIVAGIVLIIGVPVGLGALKTQPVFPSGIGGVMGSMLIVMFAYAGFEIIGLAASEAGEPHTTIPRAIRYTVVTLIGIYITAILVLLPLIQVNELTGDESPMVLALTKWGIDWAGSIMSMVLITAIFSSALASMFGVGRLMRTLASDGHAPAFLKDDTNIPYKGLLASGAAMLIGLYLGFLLPENVYVFLVSSGGFSLLFTYLIIMLTHYKFRKKHGCPPKGKCQLPGFPFTSWFAIISMLAIILSMPLIEGQQYGLLTGVLLVFIFTVIYFIKKHISGKKIK